jgi:hypothetical protein
MTELSGVYKILIVNEGDVVEKFKEQNKDIFTTIPPMTLSSLGVNEIMKRIPLFYFIRINFDVEYHDLVFYDKGHGKLVVIKDNTSKFSVNLEEIHG